MYFENEGSVETLADHMEASALVEGVSSVEELEHTLDMDDEDAGANGEEVSLLMDDTALRIEGRSSALGGAYPFTFDGGVLSAQDWQQAPAYTFQLLMSIPDIRGSRNGSELYEVLVTEALGQYLGGGSKLRFGWPNRSPVPSHPIRALDYLADQLREVRGRRGVVKARDKDMGLDAVAWKPFVDNKPGHVTILCQCATGTRWKAKIGEPNKDRWENLILFTTRPSYMFAVPWVLEFEDQEWVVSYKIVVFDRVRASSHLDGWVPPPQVSRWCERRIREFRKL